MKNLARRRAARGFSLVTAIFLLVVIAVLGAFAVTLSTTQQQAAALDVLGVRAYHAARAGVDWGAYQLLRNPAGIACSAGGTANALAMPAGTTLEGFTVSVNCISLAPVSEAANTVTLNQLVSTASRGAAGAPDYVERQIGVTIAR